MAELASMLSMPPDPGSIRQEDKHEVLFIDLAPYRSAMKPEQFAVFEERYHDAREIYSSITAAVEPFVVEKMPSDLQSDATLDDRLTRDEDGEVIIPQRVYTPQEQQWWDMYVSTVRAINDGVKHSEKSDATLARDVAFMVLKSALHQYLTQNAGLTPAEWYQVNKALGPIFTSASAITGPLKEFRGIREPIQAECITELNTSDNFHRAKELEDCITEFAHNVNQLDRLGSWVNLQKQGIEFHDTLSNVVKAWFDPLKASPLGITTWDQAMQKDEERTANVPMRS